MRQQRSYAAAALAVLFCAAMPPAAPATEMGAGTDGGVRVFLDDDTAIVVPGALMAEVEALLLHDDPARVNAALRDLVARRAQQAPMLAEAIRRIVARRRATRRGDATPEPAAGDIVPSSANAQTLSRPSSGDALRPRSHEQNRLDPRRRTPERVDIEAEPGHATARLDPPRRAFAFHADPIHRAAPSGLLAPSVGAVGPLLAPIASPVRP